MKELQWRDGMTIEEKIDAGFKEVLRRFDIQDQEMNGLRQFMNQKFFEINRRFEKIDERFEKIDERFEKIDERFDKMDSKMDGVLKTLRNHDEDIVILQKAAGQK